MAAARYETTFAMVMVEMDDWALTGTISIFSLRLERTRANLDLNRARGRRKLAVDIRSAVQHPCAKKNAVEAPRTSSASSPSQSSNVPRFWSARRDYEDGGSLVVVNSQSTGNDILQADSPSHSTSDHSRVLQFSP
jgi:hypothetical protein